MDVISLVIGTSALLAVADASCNVVQIFNDAKSFPEEMSDLLAQVSLECIKVHVWSLEASLSAPNERMRGHGKNGPNAKLFDLHMSIIQQCADGVGRALDDVRKIAAKYMPPSSETSPSPKQTSTPGREYNVQNGAQEVAAMFLSATVPATRQALKTRLQRKRRESHLKRLNSWKRISAVSKPWGQPDKEALQERLERLKYWNDQICCFWRPHEELLVQRSVAAHVAADINNTRILGGVQRATRKKDGDMAKSTALAVQVMNSDTQLCHSCDKYTIRIVDLQMHDGDLGSSGTLRCRKPTMNGRVAVGETFTVHVEWLDYSRLSSAHETVARGRIHALCHLLDAEKPALLQTLQFVGHVHNIEDKQIGILSRRQNPAERLVPLRQVIEGSSSKVPGNMSFPRPAVEERLHLALRLARSFMELHKAHWLHKGFSSTCVLLDASNSSVRVDTAVVSGFQYARPGGNEQVSLPVSRSVLGDRMWYLHPEIRDNISTRSGLPRAYVKYMARHDLYSLGVVLAEIGLWKPIEQVADPKSERFADSLRSRAKNNLPFYMGSRYAAVVDRCLAGPQTKLDIPAGLDQDLRLSHERAVEIESMFDEILRPLEECQNFDLSSLN
ncbi:hypothetical protein Daus18300_013429 [Diaporthe australafricana]|uniref:Protein kinase domain-containing protein n=1 Tax=Diaporthe australafricana TaxID=127596 RepID=A0ABR3VZ23_9PEZI